METTKTAKRVSILRKVGWMSVVSMLGLAMLAPGASSTLGASFSGAIWTSLANGTTVNANIYASMSDVYLNGGPQNCGNSGGLPDGVYYFQVTDPSGSTLLSTDAIQARQVIVIGGVIAGNGDGTHLEGTTGCQGGLPVQLMPYDPTPNPGGEYSVDMAPKADVEDCPAFNAQSDTFNFLTCSTSKNDNYKVRLQEPAIAIDKVASPTTLAAGGGNVTYTYAVTNPGDVYLYDVSVTDDKCSPVNYVSGDTDVDEELDLDETWNFQCIAPITVTTVNTATAHGWYEIEVTAQDTATVTVLPPTAPPVVTDPPTLPPTAPPTKAPTAPPTAAPTPVQTVLAETSAPRVTLPPTDSLAGTAAPSGDSWRMLLIAAAVLLASVLVMTPAKASRRRR